MLDSTGITWPELEPHLASVPSRSGFFTKPIVQDGPAESPVKRRK